MTTPSKGRLNRPRLASLIMIGAAVVGFVVSEETKKLYRVSEDRLSASTTAPLSVSLSPLSEHTVEFFAVDEERGFQWAAVDARFAIRDQNGTRLVEKTLNASASEEEGGLKRATIGDTIQVPAGPTDLHIDVQLLAGDYVDVAIFRDLPSWTAIAPGIYILLGLVGTVLFLKTRAAA